MTYLAAGALDMLNADVISVFHLFSRLRLLALDHVVVYILAARDLLFNGCMAWKHHWAVGLSDWQCIYIAGWCDWWGTWLQWGLVLCLGFAEFLLGLANPAWNKPGQVHLFLVRGVNWRQECSTSLLMLQCLPCADSFQPLVQSVFYKKKTEQKKISLPYPLHTHSSFFTVYGFCITHKNGWSTTGWCWNDW